MEWKTIESAPKDGTCILIAGGEDDQARYAGDPADAQRLRAPCRAWWDGGDWIVALAEACYVAVTRENPTHWMPIPSPPGGSE